MVFSNSGANVTYKPSNRAGVQTSGLNDLCPVYVVTVCIQVVNSLSSGEPIKQHIMKKINLYPLLTLLVAFVAVPCFAQKAKKVDMDKLRMEVQAMEDEYARAMNAGDAEAVVAYYADDAVSLAPEEPPIKGKAAILESIKEELADMADEGGTIRFETADLWAQGNLVVEVGNTIVTKGDEEMTVGKYMSVFERRDGKLLCVRDIYNSNMDDDDDEDEEDD